MALSQSSVVLVTGATGFIGTALVQRLSDMGCVVRAISRRPRVKSDFERVPEKGAPDRMPTWFAADLCDAPSLTPIFDGVTHVFHVAAQVKSSGLASDFHRANVAATQTVCSQARHAGVECLVHVGTSDVFGIPKRGETITEESSYSAWREPYPDSKIEGVRIVKSYRDTGLPAVIVHPGWVYGPGDRAFFPPLIEQIQTGLMPVWSPPDWAIHLVFIDDLVEALIRAGSLAGDKDDEFLILDDNSEVSFSDLCRRIAAAIGMRCSLVPLPYAAMYAIAWASGLIARAAKIPEVWLATADVKSFGNSFKYSTDRARRRLGWEPQTPFDAGFATAVEWQRKANLQLPPPA